MEENLQNKIPLESVSSGLEPKEDSEEVTPVEGNTDIDGNEGVGEDVTFEQRLDLSELKASVDLIQNELAKVIVGQRQVATLLITALLAEGHVLLEGVPGTAKTITANC